ncbi:MAG: holin [Coriobacteriales bacterium]|jgi:hypothetical protein|nr:holin [Coriobacteriales bacterium]
MWTKENWKAIAERAISTFAESLVIAIGAGQVGLLDIDWPAALGLAGTMTLLSVLKNLIIKPPEVTAQAELDTYKAQRAKED